MFIFGYYHADLCVLQTMSPNKNLQLPVSFYKDVLSDEYIQ